ncbi:hypothetical protein H8356DRAFT_1322388 [Neocallimastix lanati (nom. inval.)]|nr:hypothetical protein H8356DRAFT_1322388 [Neocallimastix sp. JGI-2020a]
MSIVIAVTQQKTIDIIKIKFQKHIKEASNKQIIFIYELNTAKHIIPKNDKRSDHIDLEMVKAIYSRKLLLVPTILRLLENYLYAFTFKFCTTTIQILTLINLKNMISTQRKIDISGQNNSNFESPYNETSSDIYYSIKNYVISSNPTIIDINILADITFENTYNSLQIINSNNLIDKKILIEATLQLSFKEIHVLGITLNSPLSGIHTGN